MKRILFTYLIATVCLAVSAQDAARETSVLFAGTTPCGNAIRPLHKISPEGDCAAEECKCVMVEWKLILYRDKVTSAPTRYELTSINRFIIKETNMYSKPGTKSKSEGKWTIVKGTTTKPDAVVYKLNPDKPGLALDFLKLSDNLIHILGDGKLMIGNEFWSYTLTRLPIEKQTALK